MTAISEHLLALGELGAHRSLTVAATLLHSDRAQPERNRELEKLRNSAEASVLGSEAGSARTHPGAALCLSAPGQLAILTSPGLHGRR